MKRLLSISLLAVACAALVSPEPVHAGAGKGKHGKKKGKKKGKKGKHHHDDDDDDGHHHHDDDDDGGGGGGGSGGAPGKTLITGAGQRGVASFGGRIAFGQHWSRGAFAIDIHPIAPSGTTLSIACRFNRFDSFVLEDNRVTFRGHGGCRVLRTDGTIMRTSNTNLFEIIDTPSGDRIDVNFVGETGISIPGGPLEFGNLVITPPSST